MSSKTIGVALFGLGRIGQTHLKNIVAKSCLEVRWLVDVPAQHENIAKIMKKYRLDSETKISSTDDKKKVLSDSRVDVVIICAPTPIHVELIKDSLSAGKHVFCEKPLALTSRDVKSCYATAKEHNKILFCAYNRRFDKQFSAVYQRYKAGDIGSLRVLKMTSRDAGQSQEYLRANKGGIFLDMGIHDIDFICWLADKRPTSVYASASRSSENALIYEAEKDFDSVTAIINFPGGAMAQMELCRECEHGYDQTIEVLGNKGILKTQNLRTSDLLVISKSGSELQPYFNNFLTRYRESFALEMEHFIDAVQGKTDILVSPESCILSMEVSEALAESLRSGSIVKM